jgi:hypothetical protein
MCPALDPRTRDLLTGLAPAIGGPCARCGAPTAALANGRGRVEICAACGTLDLQDHEGASEVVRLRANLAAPGFPTASVRRRGSP